MYNLKSIMGNITSNKEERKSFKNIRTYDERFSESQKILQKFPDRIPIIVEKSSYATTMSDIDKNKYLVPDNLTMGQFAFVIRKRVKMPPEQALFFFIGQIIPAMNMQLNEIYVKNKDVDGFLYITYSNENTFG
jgi:GABA(A) receptor-associated protein